MNLSIAGRADLNSSDALHTVAERGRYEMVKFLIGKGANVNAFGFEYCIGDSKFDEAVKLVLRYTLLWMQMILKLRSFYWRTAWML